MEHGAELLVGQARKIWIEALKELPITRWLQAMLALDNDDLVCPNSVPESVQVFFAKMVEV